ncbi:MAG: DegQ family serine endoprotease [Nitrospirota bacterium]|nr:DegQ family serine endoprotease [Nitrospirota bacterium]
MVIQIKQGWYRWFFAIAAAVLLLQVHHAQAKDGVVPQESKTFLKQLSASLADVAEAVKPSVVNVSTTTSVSTEANPYGDMFKDPFFRRFFGDQFDHPNGGKKQPKRKSAAMGSGVIVSTDGYILTNNHVIKDADEITVLLSDKREFKGKVIGSDPKTDLAVIKIDARDLPVLSLADSDGLKIGDVVFAVGNPFGLNQTITMGIVSAVGRSNVGIADYEDFIQTDAAINPGNSGGALVNTDGKLVGINTAIFSTSGGYMGIGFAIPSNMVRMVMDSVVKHGKVVRGWLGVSIQNLTKDLAEHFSLKERRGALVTDVSKDSPAEKAGMKRSDVILSFNGRKVEDTTGLRNMVAETKPGSSAEVTVIREGKEKTLKVTVGELPDKEGKMTVRKAERDNALKGVTVQELSADLRKQLNIDDDVNGVVVTDVAQDSAAAGVLGRGDVIQQVDQKDVSNIADFEKALAGVKAKDTVLLLVTRKGGSLFLTIKP